MFETKPHRLIHSQIAPCHLSTDIPDIKEIINKNKALSALTSLHIEGNTVDKSLLYPQKF